MLTLHDAFNVEFEVCDHVDSDGDLRFEIGPEEDTRFLYLPMAEVKKLAAYLSEIVE